MGGSGSDGVTITTRHMTAPGLEDRLEKHTKRFKEKTGITVKYQTMGWGSAKSKQMASIGSRSGPDVEEIASTWIPQQAAAGGWMDMKTIKGFDIKSDRFFDPPMKVSKYNGKVVGMPWYWGPRGHLTYDPLMKKAGISKAPGTWDQLVKQGKAFHREFPEKHLLALPGVNAAVSHLFANFLWQNGGMLLNEDNTEATFNTDRGVRAANFWRKLITKNPTVPKASVQWDGPARDSAFINKRVGSVWGALPTVNTFTEQEGVSRKDFSIAKLPKGPHGESSVFFGLELVGIHPWTDHPEASAKWVNYLMQPEVNADFALAVGFLPTVMKAFELKQFQGHLFQSFKNEILPTGRTFPQVQGWGQIETILVDAVSGILTNAATGNWNKGDTRNVLDTAAKQADSILKKD
jgi:multiple sugar transport system substrate-binding protein